MRIRTAMFSFFLLMTDHAFAEKPFALEIPQKITIQDIDGKDIKTFTIDQLKTEFTQHVYETRTPWTDEDKKAVYRGPSLEDVMKKSGASWNKSIKVIAYDDYNSIMPIEAINKFKPILAIETIDIETRCIEESCNNENRFKPITSQNKGPILFVWPFEELESEYTASTCIFWVFSPVILRIEK